MNIGNWKTIGLCMTMACTWTLTSCNVIEDEELPTYEETSIVNVGDSAPEFSIESLDGEILTIPNSEVTLLILFSHTCPDCKNMMCDLQEYLTEADDRYNIIAISRGGTTEEISTFRAQHDLRFAIAADPTKEIYYKYATMYVPRCYIIDKDNVIRFTTYEYSDGDITELIENYNTL